MSARRSRDRSIWDANATQNHFGDFTEMVAGNGRAKPRRRDTSVRRLSLDCFALLAMTDRAFISCQALSARADPLPLPPTTTDALSYEGVR
jgi:hypothetical protein